MRWLITMCGVVHSILVPANCSALTDVTTDPMTKGEGNPQETQSQKAQNTKLFPLTCSNVICLSLLG